MHWLWNGAGVCMHIPSVGQYFAIRPNYALRSSMLPALAEHCLRRLAIARSFLTSKSN